MTLYEVLGVKKTATTDQIKRAYKKLASKHHPDRGGDEAAFKAIKEAYETLSDPRQRLAYDGPSASDYINSQEVVAGNHSTQAIVFVAFITLGALAVGAFGDHLLKQYQRNHPTFEVENNEPLTLKLSTTLGPTKE